MFIKPRKMVIHVNIVGDVNAPVVVLLHSLGTNLHIWDEQVNVLKKSYRVLSIDMRGHGLSELSAEPFTIEDMANDVLSVIDYFNIKSFSIAGVSIGGLIAQHLADNVPEILNSVILIDTYLAPVSKEFWVSMAKNIRTEGLNPYVDEIFNRWVTAQFRETPSAVGMKQMLYSTSSEGYAGCADALAKINPDKTCKQGLPVLVIVGEEDIVATPTAARQLAQARKGELKILNNASHIPLLEKADEINTEMLRFLNAGK
ncbi:hypothetical protein B1H58_20420 (plasmid) [Pantoea alhagi]|uniref:AB hydrolase-1 domain-containing protein n=1 Tax=Pantoea alhagi TaxID=1891675 RepID=A0A1W6BBC5_9GAMM|nr:alpha/beta fold hydrolase [Pantoea alhagi]ARJ44388.1 hypothetical protein B1H58_20420 [Pantoea alhagi]